jgi:2-oxoglutarate dehydrogenase E1 component
LKSLEILNNTRWESLGWTIMFDDFGINAGFVEEQYFRYLENPQLVDPTWRDYFRKQNGHTPNESSNGHARQVQVRSEVNVPTSEAFDLALVSQAKVTSVINAYRSRAHLFADVNPLMEPTSERGELALSNFGLSDVDLSTVFSATGLGGDVTAQLTLREIVAILEETYCRSIGIEFTHIEEHEARTWLQQKMESSRNRVSLTTQEQLLILTKLTDAEALEQFIHRNYVGAKRFSLEGAESLIPLLDRLIEHAAIYGVEEVVLGMAHRGRLNVLCNILNKNLRELFAAFDDGHPERHLGSGDVKYHLGSSTDVLTSSGKTVHLTLAFNPSHLEWVNPVVAGRARAKQDARKDTSERRRVMPLLIHGDAAFMGQGIVSETLNLANLEGYRVGGTVHVIVNNQIGFTTNPSDSRSTRYATDIARMLKVPVFHVNGEDPEAVVQVVRLAAEFRQRFQRDVIIDMYCYRKWGHNEGDEPRFTQPVMYAVIDEQPSVRAVYVKRLFEMGQVTQDQVDEITKRSSENLTKALEETRKGDFSVEPSAFGAHWRDYTGGPEANVPPVDTRVAKDALTSYLKTVSSVPESFHINTKLKGFLDKRFDTIVRGGGMDWGAGEALAFASLLAEGTTIRLSGQDCRRGTFSHRHSVFRDIVTGEPHTPLNSIAAKGAHFEVWDSPLSESGVLGFDYGYSLDSPSALVCWEAQFGDFVNSAQVIIDQFIVAAEDKWHRLSGLVLLLPHGYEGQGPEHSSARLERFLQLAAEDNIQVCNLTTPAQYFHVLRRQVLRRWRKPLVIMSPKSLLRHPHATSTLDDLASGKFHCVLGDQPDHDDQPARDPKAVKKILLCSGKIYYELVKARADRNANDVAILRLEQIYPLNQELVQALEAYPDGTPLVWVQDEPWNMGAWYYLNARLPKLLGGRFPIRCASRPESASPATGSANAHKIEQRMLTDEAFSE